MLKHMLEREWMMDGTKNLRKEMIAVCLPKEASRTMLPWKGPSQAIPQMTLQDMELCVVPM